MRLFVAINFNDDTRSSLLILRDELRTRSKRGNFSLPENIHLTLAFLGECSSHQTVTARSALNTVITHRRQAGIYINLQPYKQLTSIKERLRD